MESLLKSFDALLSGEPNTLANLANATAFLNESLDQINWLGFYLWDEEAGQLILGPFQGKVACTRIDSGSGVCGTAFQNQESIRVPDVHQFEGHIVCDSDSQSELVIPFSGQSGLTGVLDIDSPQLDRFSEEEQAILENYVQILEKYI